MNTLEKYVICFDMIANHFFQISFPSHDIPGSITDNLENLISQYLDNEYMPYYKGIYPPWL